MPSLAQSPEQHLAQLSSALSTLTRTRQAIPSLVASVSAPLAPLDRANLYRSASAECHAAIKQLAEELNRLEDVLKVAEESERKDPQGIVVRPVSKREQPTAVKGADPWQRVGEILGGAAGSADAKGKGRQSYRPRFDVPSSPQALADLARRWQAEYPRVRIELVGTANAEQRQMTVTLRGVLRAVVKLRWEGREQDLRACETDWVCVYSLKEDRPPYLPSCFSLFQSLTNDATDIIDRCRQRRAEGERVASVEELLAFLSDPPLPF
ncbi:hypothetical protein NBRC10512_002085 [Rhodotorula toruloides]|uniref:RHTO0S11e03378g1_1 n=2 Tax=Rhodotorula toruloides TaxID=5286 RepID=A0A061BFD3_RHOTO|nr:uncharacterized protein RHTO_01715 [Rhodotorula toruloides NP11]EMS21655.1 hypothetical protein RHTO_01715 [Rhodotorula toruloides NP11]KAJ8292464.1 hypothetical protein OF846_004243 [Rhodotorula toruloides]CDR45691.1 RHTO0S11e03378g1_1 [Rhodotorula toruloides]